MGLDISAHPVDVALVRDRLVPFVMGQGDIDDLIDRAAAIAEVAFRANAWGLGVSRASNAFHEAQQAVAPKRTHQFERERKKPSLFARLFGAKDQVTYETVELPDPVPGLPGFDSDLSIWGRPFFITGDDAGQALKDYARYMALAGQDESAVDQIAQEMIARLEAGRNAFPVGTSDTIIAASRAVAPLKDLVQPDSEGHFNREQLRAALRRQSAIWRRLYAARDAATLFDGDTLEELDPAQKYPDRYTQKGKDLLPSLPHSLMAFHAALLPGWMGRGYGYATSMLEKIGVDFDDLFETPAALFAPLIAQAPNVGKMLFDTIHENFSLGGYVPPEKMAQFVARIEKNARALSDAWEPHNGELSLEYRKIHEPALYALQNGFGYLEGAEIYSGPLGMMN